MKIHSVKQASTPESEEILRLKKENEELKKVNYILKRASAFFAQDHLK
jgi:transposase-like protein